MVGDGEGDLRLQGLVWLWGPTARGLPPPPRKSLEKSTMLPHGFLWRNVLEERGTVFPVQAGETRGSLWRVLCRQFISLFQERPSL